MKPEFHLYLNLLQKLEDYSKSSSLPDYSTLMDLADRTGSVLENEPPFYRPQSKDKLPGGLLDFTGNSCARLPVVVIPDLHARAYFLYNIMNYKLPGSFLPDESESFTVFQALEQKKIFVVSVGDLLHSELRGRERWLEAWRELTAENSFGSAMKQEMCEGLSLLCMVMELKCAFPEHFHILKGNHENILNESSCGNYSFCKFADEGVMVRRFMVEEYGDEVLYVISCFEKALPLAAAFKECVISHGEPVRGFSRQELIEAERCADVIKGLTWTENNQAQIGGVELMLCMLTNRRDFLNARYLAGHRPVKENYALRQNGYFIQIHNPERQNIALVHLNRIFNPDEDIVKVGQ